MPNPALERTHGSGCGSAMIFGVCAAQRERWGSTMSNGRSSNPVVLLVLVVMSQLSVAQSPGNIPPRDPLPMIQFAQTIAAEMGALCSNRFPELKASIDRAYESWPLRSISISIRVNGMEYQNPALAFLVSTMRRDFSVEEETKSRKGC